MLSTILFYLFSCSSILVYGIGVNRLLSLDDRLSSIIISFIKAVVIGIGTSVLTFVMTDIFLLPLDLAELYPFVAVLLFTLISFIVEIFISIGIKNSASEFAVPLLSILLGVNEGTNIFEVMVITVFSIGIFYILYAVIFCLRGRISVHTPDAGLKNYSILILSLGVIIIALYGWNASWLNFQG